MKTDEQKGWNEKGIAQGEADVPRSYDIETKSGMQRRNRRHLKNMPPTVVQPEAAEKPSSSDRPREQDISIQKPKQDISVQKPKQDISVQKPKQDISVQKPKQDISVQKISSKTKLTCSRTTSLW